jgi:DNA-binding NtrC family response regulator
MNKQKILIADDDQSIASGLAAILEDAGYQVDVAHDGQVAREQLAAEGYGVALIDLMMPEPGGLELLAELQRLESPTECIIITGQASVDSAVEAMRKGAYDYIEKPITAEKLGRLKALIPKALEKYNVQQTNRQLVTRLEGLTRYGELSGQSESMRQVYQVIDAVAASTASVLILGESGTGKELVARALHTKSERAKGPFFALNCAALPRDILENELFGHEKGAFTGSTNEKAGAFEMAHGGTLFLDELAEMSPEIQVKLLRALEARVIRRLGGKKEIPVDIRILAATNRDVLKAVTEGQLREDLYYRLAVVEIHLPPLRERMGDLQLLASEFLARFAKQNGKKISGFDDDATRWMIQHRWPGNVRELKNAVERAVILATGPVIRVSDLAMRTGRSTPELSTAAVPDPARQVPDTLLGLSRDALFEEFARFLRERHGGGNGNGATAPLPEHGEEDGDGAAARAASAKAGKAKARR